MRVVIVAVAAALAVAASARTAVQPQLRVASAKPLRIAGANFERREHVRVRFSSAGSSITRQVIASRGGTFVVGVGGQRIDPCNGPVRVVAIGSGGSRAVKLLPQRQCLPA